MKKLWLAALVLSLIALIPGCGLVAGQLLAQFDLELEPQQVAIPAGGSGQVTVRINPLTGIAVSSVTVSLIQKPIGVTADPNAMVVFSESAWTILVDETVAPGVYEDLEVQAVSQGLNLIPVTKTATLTLSVTAAED